MKNILIFTLLQIISTLVGIGMLASGYLAPSNALTGGSFPLNKFFYAMGAFVIVCPIILFGTIKYLYRRAVKKIAYIKEHGIKGTARVLSMERTNIQINRIPQMVLQLNIKTSLGEQFQASYKKCIEPVYYNLIRPDADLPVYVHPTNRKSLYVDFKEALSQAGNFS